MITVKWSWFWPSDTEYVFLLSVDDNISKNEGILSISIAEIDKYLTRGDLTVQIVAYVMAIAEDGLPYPDVHHVLNYFFKYFKCY